MAVSFNTNTFHRGKLRYKATFRNPTYTNDGAGGQTTTYADVWTTRCQMIYQGGDEVLGRGQVYFTQDFTLRCGYRTPTNIPITTDTIIVVNGPRLPATIFKINSFQRVDMKSHIYEFKITAS